MVDNNKEKLPPIKRANSDNTKQLFAMGGQSCKKEDWRQNKHVNPIQGLNCDYITDSILAMQRPSTRIIQQYDIINQFKQQRIKAIFNFQLPGEHPYCGDGFQRSSGFSYHPDEFNANGIYFFNFGWVDMTVPDYKLVMKIVAHMDFILQQGEKVAVHCHAGTGRTAVGICSWLIASEKMDASDAIKLFQSKRNSSLTKSAHRKFLVNLQHWIKENQKTFSLPFKVPMEIIIMQQQQIIFGPVKEETKNIPLILFYAVQRLEQLMQCQIITPEQACASFFALDNKKLFPDSWNKDKELEVQQLKKQIDDGQWEFSNFSDCRVISQTLLDFFDQLPKQAIKNETAISLEEQSSQQENIQRILSKPRLVLNTGKYEFAVLNFILKFAVGYFSLSGLDQQLLELFYLRISISLLGKRKKLDDHFLMRSIINPLVEEKITQSLKNFFISWAAALQDTQSGYNHNVVERAFFRITNILKHSKQDSQLKTQNKNSNAVQQEPQDSLQRMLDENKSIIIGQQQQPHQLQTLKNIFSRTDGALNQLPKIEQKPTNLSKTLQQQNIEKNYNNEDDYEEKKE